MALVFNTPKSALNTTSKDIQNLSSDCPPCPEVNLTTADVEYTENGEYTVTPEEGYDGLTQVDITVNIPSDVKNQDKFVTPTTSSQTITADSGYSGLGTVSVSAVTSSIDANIAAGNIKSGVTILGVTGTVTEGITPTGNINITNTNSTDVTNYATAQVVDANLTAGNIKSGTTILGVQGSYDPQPDLETKSVTYTTNDTYTITPTAGKDGMSSVEVTVNVSGSNCPDWSTIGWDCNDVTASGLAEDVVYAAQKKAEYEAGTITTFKSDKKMRIVPNNIDFTNKRISLGLFQESGLCYAATLDFNGANTLSLTNMFYSTNIKSVTLLNTSSNTDCASTFTNCFSLKNVNLFDTSRVTSMAYMFLNCWNLPSIPLFNTSKVNSMVQMFKACYALSTVPLFDMSRVTNASGMFTNCTALSSVPLFNLSSVTDMSQMFSQCSALVSVPQFDTSNVTNMYSLFSLCTALTTIPMLDASKVYNIMSITAGCSSLTTLGGFVNLGKGFTSNSNMNTLDLSASTLLTKESIMNVINHLAAPDNTAVTNATLKLSATSYALLDASDIAIATAKNWTVTSA